jgi:hypothetical protein
LIGLVTKMVGKGEGIKSQRYDHADSISLNNHVTYAVTKKR